jgi:dipeptidase
MMGALAGAAARRACTTKALAAPATLTSMRAALRDHAGHEPADGLTMQMTCAHASFWPTRTAGQTTASMIARLPVGAAPELWLTGTSSPCLSVFKPAALEGSLTLGPPPRAEGADGESLWWRHERLHRAVMRDWQTRAPFVQERARALEERGATFEEHRAVLDEWWRALPAARDGAGPTAWYWSRQSRRDALNVAR